MSIAVRVVCRNQFGKRGGGVRADWAKMGGGMEANKNKFIEDWGTVRENLEYNFRWTRRNLALVGIFGIVVPVLIYKGTVKEFHMQDEDAGRPYRNFGFDYKKWVLDSE